MQRALPFVLLVACGPYPSGSAEQAELAAEAAAAAGIGGTGAGGAAPSFTCEEACDQLSRCFGDDVSDCTAACGREDPTQSCLACVVGTSCRSIADGACDDRCEGVGPVVVSVE